MSKSDFSELLHKFSAQPHDLPAILAAVTDAGLLFDAAKLFIQDTLSYDGIDKAEQAVQFVWAIAQHTSEPEHNALAHWCSGIFFDNRDVKRALYHFQTAQAYYQQTAQQEKEGRILIGCANQLNLLGHLDEAEAAIQRAIDYLQVAPNYRDWPLVYINFAYIQVQQGRYSDALASARQAEALAIHFGKMKPELDSRYRWMRAQALVNQGYAALPLGHFAAAQAAFRDALELAALYKFSEIAGRAAFNLGRIAIIKGELFDALQFLHTASAYFEAAQIKIDQATVAIEKAKLYERLTMMRHARHEAMGAAGVFAQASIPAESVEAYLLAVRLSLALDDPPKAHLYLAEVQKLLTLAPPLQQILWRSYHAHPILQQNSAQRHQVLVEAEQAALELYNLGALNEALEVDILVAQLAAQLRLPDVSQRLEKIIQTAHQHGLSAHEQQACILLGQRQKSDQAIQTWRRAADVLTYTRSCMPIEELKAYLLTGHTSLYTHLIEAQIKIRQWTEAVNTLLEAKGGIWADVAAPFSAQPPAHAWVRARAELAFWRDEQRVPGTPEYQALCRTKVHEAELALAEAARLHARIREPQPVPSCADIQSRLGQTTIALEYLVGTTYIWVCLLAGTQPPRWIKLGKCQAVKELLGRYALQIYNIQSSQTPEQRRQVAHNQESTINVILQRLYEHLFTPLLAYLPTDGTLIIAPDSYLFETPWTALYDGIQYLGQQYTLSLTPSTALLSISPLAPVVNTSQSSLRALGFVGDPPLPFVAKELTAIQHAFPEGLIANPASATDFTWDRPPTFLHVAAHGHIRRDAPLLSALELANGPFLLTEVLNLNLHGTRLATLSGCETGTTPEQGGVLLALVGAFLCAGAENVLASLWSVDDEATQILMADLYQHLHSGLRPALALQQAQQAVRSIGYTHPFYWAAFQPLGRTL